MDRVYFVFVFAILFCLLFCLCHAALLSPSGKGLTSCFLVTVFITFKYGILGQVWHLSVSISDLCLLPYNDISG